VVDHLIFDIKGWQLIVVVLFVAAVVVIGRRKRPWTSAAKAGSIDPCVRHDWSRALIQQRLRHYFASLPPPEGEGYRPCPDTRVLAQGGACATRMYPASHQQGWRACATRV